MALIDGLLQELEHEAKTTRRVLERVPGDRLTWKPHERARTLGELALHVAAVPGGVAMLVASPSPAQAPQFVDPSPKSVAELIPKLEWSIAKAREMLGGMDDAAISAPFHVDERRSRALHDSARRAGAVGHAQPLVSPSRPVDGLPARAGRGSAVDLRTERG